MSAENWHEERDRIAQLLDGIESGKITHIDKQPMSLGLQYYHNLEHPRFAGAEQVRFIASFLWPTAEAAAAAEKSTVARKKSGDQ